MPSIKKNILLLPHNLEVNGSNTFLIMLANSIRDRFNVSILAELNKGGKILDFYRKNNIQIIFFEPEENLADILKRYDLIIVNTLMQSDKVELCIKHQIPHCFIIHENWSPKKINYIKALWGITNLDENTILFALQNTQSLIFPAKYLIHTYQDFINPDVLQTIYCAIDTKRIEEYIQQTTKERERNILNLPSNHLIFLQVGTVTQRKGQLFTLKSFIKLRKNNAIPENTTLILVGARNYRPGECEYINKINELIVQNNLNNFVRVYSVQENILQFIIASDIVVHPSTSEVLPIALLESGYCKRPIITSNMDGMPEIIEHQKSGLLIEDPHNVDEIASAMALLSNNENLRTIYGEAAHQLIKKQHSPDSFRDQYIREFTKQLENQT